MFAEVRLSLFSRVDLSPDVGAHWSCVGLEMASVGIWEAEACASGPLCMCVCGERWL